VPRNVLESAERLRRELHPERGPVDWRPIRERRTRAEARIQAVEDYARERRCRRSKLVNYFGEKLRHCSGCDCCGTNTARPPADPVVSARLTSLRRVLADSRTSWGGCPLEPDVLLRLARQPPTDAAALADVPGVGPSLTQRLGRTILGALGTGAAPTPQAQGDGVFAALDQWRNGVADAMGVPAYAVVSDGVLRSIAAAQPRSRLELARIRGVGPRTLAKFSDDLLSAVSSQRPDSYCRSGTDDEGSAIVKTDKWRAAEVGPDRRDPLA
jgi:ribonuclease D